MTSAKARTIAKASKASRDLNIALGRERVNLAALHPKELENLIQVSVVSSEIRELRGFKELRETLSRNGDERLVVANNAVTVRHNDSPLGTGELSLKSHTVNLCRGVISQELTYRRHESNEETTDWRKYHSWGKSAYLYKGTEEVLLMRRFGDDIVNRNQHLLVLVSYEYEKVPNQSLYSIDEIIWKPLPISGFCRHFGKEAPDVAQVLFWELASIYKQTATALENKATQFREETNKMQRLADSVGT